MEADPVPFTIVSDVFICLCWNSVRGRLLEGCFFFGVASTVSPSLESHDRDV